jgi:hypothetical protein
MRDATDESTKSSCEDDTSGVVMTIHDLAEFAQHHRLGIPEEVLRDLLFAIEERHHKILNKPRFRPSAKQG